MMDADLSHRPDDLPGLLNTLSEADIVVGSRYVSGGGVMNWPLHRRLVSRGASATGRLLLGLEVRDATSGFAAFRRQAVEPILPSLNPKGFKGGRPRKLDEQQRQLVNRLYKEGTPIPEILKTVKISKSTLYSYVKNETS